jgi:flagella basal body P-ring formation protein FlgA
VKIVILISIATRVFAACHVVAGLNITGADLASVNASFSGLNPSAIIAPTPMPGVMRTFHAEEIARIARQNNIALTPPFEESCFERAKETLTPEKLMPVLHAALAEAAPDARIEILDFSHTGVPIGTLIFNRSGLSESGLWRGHVAYDQAKSAPIWVKARVTVERTRVEASQAIQAGAIIQAAQLALRTGPRFPFGPAPLDSIDHATGSKLLRTLRIGDAIFASMLAKPHDIERGDTVRVSVAAGAAHLEFDAVAQSSAHIGEHVLIKNPENSRLFQATAEDKGKVTVTK